MSMQIAATLTGKPLGLIELLCGADGRARVNDRPVLAIRYQLAAAEDRAAWSNLLAALIARSGC